MSHSAMCTETHTRTRRTYFHFRIFGAVLRTPTTHGLQFPGRWKDPHDDFEGSFFLQISGCEERTSPGAVDDETRTAGEDFPS